MTAALTPGRPFTGSERQLLENTLQLQRSELLAAVGSLSDTQARRRLVPSLTTPIAVVEHCAAAERIWFQRTLAGWSLDECTGQAVGGDASFAVADHETLADVIAEYRAACTTSDDIAAHHTLDDTAHHNLVGAVSLRFIYLGLIAEIARHAGHADILPAPRSPGLTLLGAVPPPGDGWVAQQCRQYRERVEVGDAFASSAVPQPKPVHIRPLKHVASDGRAQPELDEDHVVVASPMLDISSQAGQAAKEPHKLSLRRLNANRSRCQRLHQHHIRVQQLRQPLR